MSYNENKKANKEEFFRDGQVSWAAQEVTNEKPPFQSQVGVIFLFVFIVTSGIYANFTQAPVVIEGMGKLTSEIPPIPIKSNVTFTVEQILVKENQEVKKDQVLVTSADNLKPQDLERFKKFLGGIKRVNLRPTTTLCLDCMNEINDINSTYLTIKAQGDMLNIVSPMNDQVRQLSTQIQNYKNIDGSLSAVKLSVNNARSKLRQIKEKKAEKILAKEVEDLEATIVSGQTQINEKFRAGRVEIENSLNTLRARTKELEDKIDQFSRFNNIKAPFDGTVSNIKVKGLGELFSGGQVLMEIIPANQKLIAVMDIQNKDVADIKKGDEVIVAIDSLPEMDYGHALGSISEINRVENSDQQQQQQQAAAYRIRIAMPQQSLTKGAEEKPLLIGMTFKGRIVTKYESLLKSAYKILFKVKDDIQVKK